MEIKINNRKAYYNYLILDKLEAGIVLTGTEIKSIRLGKMDIGDGYCDITDKNEIVLLNVKISPYDFGNIFNHQIDRPRKLLMNKKEIIKLKREISQKGLTLIPLACYLKRNKLKVSIGVAKGKKVYDKKKFEKQKEISHLKAQD